MAHHLSLEEREEIAQRRAAGASVRAIAGQFGRDPGTISRELRRNRSRNGYYPSKAQEKAAQRRRNRPRVRKMDRPEVSRYVREHLKKFWSPDQVAGRMRREFPRDGRRLVSRQTIYTWIRAEAARGRQWRRYLRRAGKSRHGPEKRGKISHRALIDGRPAVVDRRTRLGDWEGDTVVGAPARGGLVTLVERKSRYLLADRVVDLKAATVCGAAADAVNGVPASHRKTVTFDNGKEFAQHEVLAQQTGIKTYFAKPYSAWQRGTNENTNGLIRQFFPKGTDLARVPPSRIDQVHDLLNNRPRRCLDYRTPHEVFTPSPARCN